MTIRRIDKVSTLVGLTLKAAQEYCEEHGYESVVVHSDNFTNTAVKDYDPLRVKLSTEKDVIVKAEIG
jgi:hypothetical protein